MKILIIEDDVNLSNTIKEQLEKSFIVEQAFDGEEGLFLAEESSYDIIILDIMLPGLNGYQVLSRLREDKNSTPVLLLTAKDGIDDKIKGFESGADDYLVKPFHREELILRIDAIIRRSSDLEDDNTLVFGSIVLNLENRTAAVDGVGIELPGKQFDILEYFMLNQDIILTKEQIFNRIWGFDSDTAITVIEVYTSNLRKTLAPTGANKYIKTIRGVGYIFNNVVSING